MKFTNLSKKEFQEFTNKKFSHYTQDIKTYDFYKKNNKEVHLVGLKDENKNIKIACLLTASRSLKIFKYFYSQRGPVFATNDKQEINFFFKSLIKYLKKNKCLYLRIDPYILENLRKPNGEIIKHHDNQDFKNIMDQLGYQHQGYTVGYSKISQIRWLSVLNLLDKSEDELLKDMNYQTRRNIKKHMRWESRFKRFLLMKHHASSNYLKWQKKNMAFLLEMNPISKKCKKCMEIKLNLN